MQFIKTNHAIHSYFLASSLVTSSRPKESHLQALSKYKSSIRLHVYAEFVYIVYILRVDLNRKHRTRIAPSALY